MGIYSQIKISIYVTVSDFGIMHIEDGSHLPEQRKEGEVKGQKAVDKTNYLPTGHF